jgi:DNA repair exonuclease SbcCD ATPase subunit
MQINKLRAKNFFSIGNAFLEIDVRKHKQTLLKGANGTGKSSICNLLTYGLFGKTLKSVNKGQIVNSINGKNCLVEIELSNNGKEYLIRRGIKPNLFEVYQGGVLVDQTTVLDYQEYLEEFVLQCSYRTFTQTSIISIENYTPFMSLPKGSRRDFIEDILDIRVFSVMNQLLKSKVTKNKDELKLIDVSIKGLRDRITQQKSHIEQLEAIQKVSLDSFSEKLNDIETELENNTYLLEQTNSKKIKLDSQGKSLKCTRVERDSLNVTINELKLKIRAIEKELVFFEVNSDCPTCQQGISHDHVSHIRASRNTTHAGYTKDRDFLTQSLEQFDDLDIRISDHQDAISKHNSDVTVINNNIGRLNKALVALNKEKNSVSCAVDVSEQKEALKTLAKEGMVLRDRLSELNTEQSYNMTMLELFKDSGVKSKIVNQYIPVINKLVNQYLEKLDFFVSFNLDSEFDEIIKSRHRDDFSYSSFSMGQKQRIDLALMFTFRQLALMLNSFSCNIMIMDETLDSSVDAEGIELLMDIFDSAEFENSNIMVISHSNKDLFQDRFDGTIEFFTRDNFTQTKS